MLFLLLDKILNIHNKLCFQLDTIVLIMEHMITLNTFVLEDIIVLLVQ